MSYRISLALLALFAGPALAADLAVKSTRTLQAVAVVPAPGLWRGHFTGGRNYAPGADFIGLDWADKVAFFPDDRSCRRWIRDLRAQYRTYEGWKGCIRIR